VALRRLSFHLEYVEAVTECLEPSEKKIEKLSGCADSRNPEKF
jgi:hypothetical protein